MIYKSSYFNKELKEAYLDESSGKRSGFLQGILFAVATLAVHLLLTSLRDTVISDTFPEITTASTFSFLFLYNRISLVLFLAYLVANYKYVTFQEISDNRWYPLIKNGYRISRMVTAKITARFFRILVVYSTGFACCLFLSAVLQYKLVIHYYFGLFFIGILDMFVLCLMSLALSHFVKKSGYMAWVIIPVYASIMLLQHITSYYDTIKSEKTMRTVASLFTSQTHTYFCIVAGVLLVSLLLIYVAAAKRAVRFSITDDINITEYIDFKTNTVKKRLPTFDVPKAINIGVSVFIGIIVAFMLAFNVAVLLMTAPEGLRITNIEPLLFQSTTMRPTIEKNDLVFFRTPKQEQNYEEGIIVRFEYEGKEYIQSIVKINEDGTYVVDILNYGLSIEKDYFKKTISKESIKGVYLGRNRWLGALVAFSITFAGRVVMVALPLILLLYRKKVADWLIERTGGVKASR